MKSVRYVSEADELGSFELKPNYRTLGPRFGKHMPQVAEAVAALDAATRPQTLREGGEVHIAIDGRSTRWAATTCRWCCSRWTATRWSAPAPTPWRWTSSWTTSCAWRASPARSCTRSRTRARRRAWRSRTGSPWAWAATPTLLDAVRAHEAYVTGETLATSLDLEGGSDAATAQIEGRELRIGVSRA